MSPTVLSLIAVLVSTDNGTQGSALELLAQCPQSQPACVRMEVHATDLESILKNRGTEGADRYSTFRLLIRGRLNDAPLQSLEVILRAYTGGIECSAFGQASVAVVAFTNEGYPVVLTSNGPLVVQDSALQIGYRGGAELLARADLAKRLTLTTPAWDLTLVGYRMSNISYDDQGHLYVQTGAACVRIPRAGSFRVVSPEQCVPMALLASYSKRAPGIDLTLEPAQWLYEVPGRDHLLFLKVGACT